MNRQLYAAAEWKKPQIKVMIGQEWYDTVHKITFTIMERKPFEEGNPFYIVSEYQSHSEKFILNKCKRLS